MNSKIFSLVGSGFYVFFFKQRHTCRKTGKDLSSLPHTKKVGGTKLLVATEESENPTEGT